mmetsp:Transcript_6668/g.9677  ORF Transcript_6668/g.9677 Transcript_6668/m.9677 type:complete len:86 (-) Transcript_6668:2232-2489(-)
MHTSIHESHGEMMQCNKICRSRNNQADTETLASGGASSNFIPGVISTSPYSSSWSSSMKSQVLSCNNSKNTPAAVRRLQPALSLL